MSRAFRYLKEIEGNPFRLGRHQVHDALAPEREASLFLERLVKIETVQHQEFVPVFNQGNLGSCTANAALGCLVTAPYGHDGVTYTEDDAVSLYELETKVDDSQIPGEYPPDDTGSSGPWSMTALEQKGLIKSYIHTRNIFTALRMLTSGPISIGVAWYESMFTPDDQGVIHVETKTGVAGGHQVAIVANDTATQHIEIRNSWGSSWGDNGHARLSWNDFHYLLEQGGDVVQPVIK